MAKQQFAGAHARTLPLTVAGAGWRYTHQSILVEAPVYTYWIISDGGYDSKKSTLWWNGARWVAWIFNVLIAEPTEHKDLNNPPFGWAEDVYTLANC